MVKIEDYIILKLVDKTYEQLANEINISAPMISNYKKGHYNPSLSTAIKIYKLDTVTLHPFSEESLQYEISKEK